MWRDDLVCIWRKVAYKHRPAPRVGSPGELSQQTLPHPRAPPDTGWATRRASPYSQTTLSCSPGVLTSNSGATESSSSLCMY